MIITLRPARKIDLMGVGALHQRSRVAAYADFLPAEALARPTPRAMGRYWTERWSYEKRDHSLTVAEHAGRLVGFSYLGPAAPDEAGSEPNAAALEPDAPGAAGGADAAGGAGADAPRTGVLHAIHLDPRWRGRGVGRQLMIDALRTLAGEGYHRAELWVLVDNLTARRFYERGGWSCDGVEREDTIGTALTRQVRYSRPLP
ncbi:GNAT family N-acetyltransferase [Plantactinospora sp. GCM10030261]|uniref:GNAT family N-acetyltransferase n=1 Tax=Plantactinospora sp. GCM10030261 TaxID=3273420 RepID=UPI00362163F1